MVIAIADTENTESMGNMGNMGNMGVMAIITEIRSNNGTLYTETAVCES